MECCIRQLWCPSFITNNITSIAQFQYTDIYTQTNIPSFYHRYCDEVIEDAPLQVSKAYLEQHGIEKVVHGTEISPEDVQKMYGPALLLGMYVNMLTWLSYV